jgi:hypothetical protein
VVAVNLANQTGREGVLSAAYADAAAAFAAQAPGFRLVPFDFHKQCGATNYARLQLLWEVGGRVCECECEGGWAGVRVGGARARVSQWAVV